MKKRVLALLMSMCLIIGLIPVTVLADDDVISGTCGEDAQYYIEDSTLYITGTGAIDDWAFMWLMTEDIVTAIVIGDGITSVGAYAFLATTGLKEVVIEGSPTIESWAFTSLEALESVTINGTGAVIETQAFSGCPSLTDVYIAGGTVAENAFSNCNSLSEITGDAEVAEGAITAGLYASATGDDSTENVTIYALEGYEFISAGIYSESYYTGEYGLAEGADYYDLEEGTDYTVSVDGIVFTVIIDLTSVSEKLTDEGMYYIRFVFEADGETEYTEIGCYIYKKSVYVEFADGVLTIWANYDAWIEYDQIIEQLEGVDLSEVTTICLGNSLCWISPLIFSSCENLESVTFTDDYNLYDWDYSVGTDTGSYSTYGYVGLYLDENGILYFISEDHKTWYDEDEAFISEDYTYSLETIWVPAGTATLVLDSALTGVGSGSLYSAADTLTEIYFTGDAPEIDSDAFEGITATVYYPEGNETWTEDVLQDYGGSITWVSYDPSGSVTSEEEEAEDEEQAAAADAGETGTEAETAQEDAETEAETESSSDASAPETGESANVMLWLCILIIAATAGTAAGLRRKLN